MNFEKLTIHNIASILDTTIDFTAAPLNSSQLFLINGPTGAGKSTILDAICLALYNSVPRLESYGNRAIESDFDGKSSIQIGDNLNIVRKDAREAWVELVFEGNDGKTYRARWEARFSKRNSSNRPAGVVEGYDHWLFMPDNSRHKLKGSDMIASPAIVGMNFNHFKRTTLLAQGDFSRFLKASRKDKCAILENLSGVQRFTEYGRRIHQRFKTAEGNLKSLNDRLGDITFFNDEQLQAKKDEQHRLAEEIASLAKEIESVRAIKNWFETDAANTTAVEQKRQTLNEAMRIVESEEFIATQERVELWNRLKPLADIDNEIAKNSEEAKRLATASDNLEIELAVIVASLHSLDDKITKAVETVCNTSDAAEGAKKNVNTAAARLDNINEQCAALVKSDAGTKLAANNARRAVLKKFVDGTAGYVTLAADVERQKTSLTTLEKNKEKALQNAGLLKTMMNEAKAAFDRADAAYQAIIKTSDNFVKALRHDLTPGCKCPVCNATVTTVVADNFFDSEIEQSEQARKKADNEAREAVDKYNTAKANADFLTAEVVRNEATLARDKNQSDTLEAKLLAEAHKLGLAGKTGAEVIDAANAGIATLDKSLAEMTEFIEQMQTMQAESKNADKQLKTLRTKLEDAERKHNNACREHDRLTGIKDTVAEILGDINGVDTAKVGSSEIYAEGDLVGHANAYKIAKTENDTRSADVTTKRNELNSARIGILAELNDIHQDKLTNPTLGLTSADIDTDSRDIEAKLKAVNDARIAFDTINETASKHAGLRPETELDLAGATALLAEKTDGKTARDRALGSVDAELRNDAGNRAKYAALLDRIKAAEAVYNDWLTLHNHFGNDKFKYIVCSYILSDLVVRANYYLQLFRPRYKMVVNTGDFEIQVEDAEMGMRRVFSTLSGGETFMASLSLALGLASMTNGVSTADTLFIDEGFGTLSSDCLETVMDSLHQLRRQEKRRVGIISHVESLRDRIPVRITLKPNGSSSLVSVSDQPGF